MMRRPDSEEWKERRPDLLLGLRLLTHAETEVLGFLVEGYSNKEIAASLSKSVNCVQSQLSAIYMKTRQYDRVRLVADYWRLILGPGDKKPG